MLIYVAAHLIRYLARTQFNQRRQFVLQLQGYLLTIRPWNEISRMRATK